MPVNQESGAGKQSFGEIVKEFMLPSEATLFYRVATGVAKAGEIALLLNGLIQVGIATFVGPYKVGDLTAYSTMVSSVALAINCGLDSRVSRLSGSKRDGVNTQ